MEHRVVERLAVTIMRAHGCHTVILYGSRARGDATAHSDVDLLCVREGGDAMRDARVVDGIYVDAFIYPEATLSSVDPSHLRLLGGVVIRERSGFGTSLLAEVRALHDRGPSPLPDDERQALVVWSRKMIDRFRGQYGLDADYRRMSLLLQALEDYFALRGAWFRGSKEAFAWLRRHDEAAYASFERAARPGASDAAFTSLVETVYGPYGPDTM